MMPSLSDSMAPAKSGEQSNMGKTQRSNPFTDCLLYAIVLGVFATPLIAQNEQNSKTASAGAGQTIHGQVLDEQGGGISRAKVMVRDSRGNERTVASELFGIYQVPVEPGTYTLEVTAQNFAPYRSQVKIAADRSKALNITLRIAVHKEEITVLTGNPMLRGAEYRGGSFVLSGEALESIPEGPGALEAILRGLALRTPGPFGPQVLINGFEGGPLPLTHSIREVRISENPFSAEYPQLGLGRIEILTKPGTERLHGEASFNYGDAVLNTRNPFASNRAPYRSQLYGGNLGGPLFGKKATFFVDYGQQDIQSNAVINGSTVDSMFNIAPLSLSLVTPQHNRSVSPRLDYQWNTNNTLTARYSYNQSHDLNSGIGEFSLASRSIDVTGQTHTAQVTETAILNAKTVNETRFQFIRNTTSRLGDNSIPTISVAGAFIGGGADIGLAFGNDNRWEVQNYISRQEERHFIRAGVQAKGIGLDNGSTQNFGGTYTFNGGLGPQLNSANQVVTSGGSPVLIPITSIEAYRRTLLFRSLGFSPSRIRQLGGGASQFSLATGRVDNSLQQYELGLFAQDDWRLTPKFTLHGGLRYEHQNNIPNGVDFAPRLAFAWALDGGNKNEPKTVLRGGAGIFYERVGERLALRALQLNGVNQQQFFSTDASILDLFPARASVDQLSRFSVPQSILQLAGDIRAPYTMHGSISLERQLPAAVSVAVTYARVRSLHLLRSRDINAPRPTTNTRPLSNEGEIFQYESSGKFNQDQLLTNLAYRASKKMTLWTTYTFSNAMTDTDGPDTFPANSYDLRFEYGPSGLTARHTLYAGGWISTPGGFELVPLILWRTGLPFNITTGRDNSGDSLFMARPSFATVLAGPDVIVTPFGAFNLNAVPGQPIIPRNFGLGPDFLIANLRVSRKFQINPRLAMIIAVQAQNIMNRTNPGLPIGSLASPLFGLSNAAAGDWGLGSNQAGNRRLEFWLFFQF